MSLNLHKIFSFVFILARIFYGVFLVIICGVGVVRLLNASNQLQSERERQSRLQLLVQPDNGLFYYKRNMEDSQAWKAKLDGSFTCKISEHFFLSLINKLSIFSL